MTKDDIFNEFLEAFGDKDGDGTVTKDEWYEYYAAVSASVDDDEYFVTMMNNAWGLE